MNADQLLIYGAVNLDQTFAAFLNAIGKFVMACKQNILTKWDTSINGIAVIEPSKAANLYSKLSYFVF